MSSSNKRSATWHLRRNRRLLFTAMLLSSGCFTFGYDASVIGGVLDMVPFIEQFGAKTPEGPVLTPRIISIMVATATTGSLVGAIINATCADRFGRKKTMFGGCVIALVAAILQTASYNLAMITVGRVLTGISVFVLVGMAVTFQNEISPPSLRGFLGALSVVSIETGAVVVSGINWGTHAIPSSLSWRLPIGLQNVWPLVIAFCTLFVTDSPTYYLIKGDDKRAEESMRKVRQGYSDADIAEEMASLRLQQSLRAAEKEIPWYHIFLGVNLRRTILAAYAGVFVTLTGQLYASTYATIFLAQVGQSNPFLLVFALNILNFGGAIIGGILVDSVGRRPLALTTFTAILIIDVVIGGLGFASPLDLQASKAIAGFLLMFGFFVAVGFGPLTYINTAEMPTARLRNKTNAYALLSNSLTSLTCTYVFPYIVDADAGNLGAKVYLIFAGLMVVCLVFTFFCFPEVKGRSAAELDEMFEARLPARKFKHYVCAVAPEHIEISLRDKAIETGEEQLETVS